MAKVEKLVAKASEALAEGDFQEAAGKIIEIAGTKDDDKIAKAYPAIEEAMVDALMRPGDLDREAASWICQADAVLAGRLPEGTGFLSMEVVNKCFERLGTCDDPDVWFNVIYYTVCITDSQMGLGMLSLQGCQEACRSRSDMIYGYCARFRAKFAADYSEEDLDDMYDQLVTGGAYLKIAAEYLDSQWGAHTRRQRFMADRLDQDEIEGRARRIYRAENSLFALLDADTDKQRAKRADKMDRRLSKFASECYAPLDTLSPSKRRKLKKEYEEWEEEQRAGKDEEKKDD
ncbi:MAG: hypothetical protein ACOX8X_05180 [Methanomethylophilus sp.]|jgi:hypothetical protein